MEANNRRSWAVRATGHLTVRNDTDALPDPSLGLGATIAALNRGETVKLTPSGFYNLNWWLKYPVGKLERIPTRGIPYDPNAKG